MRNHRYLARIPEGQERDYVRGLLKFLYNDGRRMGTFMYFVMWIVVVVMWYATIIGWGKVFGGDTNGFIPCILLMIMAGLFTWLLIAAAKGGMKVKEAKDFNNIQVWNVRIMEVIVANGKNGMSHFGKVVFQDGTPSNSQHKLELYSSERYEYGLIVAVYDDQGNIIQVRLIPQLGYNSKAYRLAMKGLAKY